MKNKEFKKFYNDSVNNFYEKLVKQFNNDRKKFIVNDEIELVQFKLRQIKSVIETSQKKFDQKTKKGLDKINSYTLNDISLFGYKKFELVLNQYLERLNRKDEEYSDWENDPALDDFIKSTPTKYESLEDACFTIEGVSKIVQALKTVSPPVIDSNNKFKFSRVNQKALKACGNIAYANDLLRASPRQIDFGRLIAVKFSGASLKPRTFEIYDNSPRYFNYANQFKRLLK